MVSLLGALVISQPFPVESYLFLICIANAAHFFILANFFSYCFPCDSAAVVDQVRNGTTIRVFVPEPSKPNIMSLVTVRFAGAQAPVPSYQEGTEDPPFAK